jgi:hypothetical protein
MRIQIEDAEARVALEALLRERGCTTTLVGQTLVAVADEPLTLQFFLRAWQARYPETQLEPV